MKSIIKLLIPILLGLQVFLIAYFSFNGLKYINSSGTTLNAESATFAPIRLIGQKYCASRNEISEDAKLDQISNVNIVANLNKDGSMDVSEQISIYLDNKHGIYRYIPTLVEAKFGNGKFYVSRSKIDNFSIYRYGIDEPVIINTEKVDANICNESGTSENQVYVKARVGSEYTILPTGLYTYEISYTVKNGLVKDPNGNLSLYWDFWGDKWYANVRNFNLVLNTPSSTNILNTNCYVGIYGDNDKSKCNSNHVGNSYTYTTSNLSQFEAVTILSKLQDSYDTNFFTNLGTEIINKNDSSNNLLRWFFDVITSIVGFLPLIITYIIYRRSGLEKIGRGIIVPEYLPPSEVSAAQAGTLIDQSVDKADLSAIIISLCTKGWMRIEEKSGFLGIGKTYEFIKELSSTRKMIDLTKEEKLVMDSIFKSGSDRVSLSELQGGELAKIFEAVKSNLYAWAVSRKYFSQSPELGLEKVAVIIGAFISGVFIFLNMNLVSILVLVISIILSLSIFKIFSVFTQEGKFMQEKILGFKMYLGTAEKNKMEFLNDPNVHDLETFEKYLPYAMALGVTKIWTDKFKDVFTNAPNWYIGPSFVNFNPTNFSDHLTSTLNSFSGTINTMSSSSSSGGGFSGGGGGGGGGGSW